MSGFAALNGEPDGPPLLPPLALADGVAGLATAFAILAALRAREQTGRGQVVDTSLVEPLMALLGPQLTRVRPARRAAAAHRQPLEPQRAAQRLPHGRRLAGSRSRRARRRSRSGSSGSSAGPTSWSSPGSRPAPGRAAHVDEIDEAVAAWIAARDRDEVLAAFEAAEAAIAPIYDASDIARRPAARSDRSDRSRRRRRARPDQDVERDQPSLRDAGRDPPTGRPHGADTAAVLGELGVDADGARTAARARESCERLRR